jgi:hypothetical protein
MSPLSSTSILTTTISPVKVSIKRSNPVRAEFDMINLQRYPYYNKKISIMPLNMILITKMAAKTVFQARFVALRSSPLHVN